MIKAALCNLQRMDQQVQINSSHLSENIPKSKVLHLVAAPAEKLLLKIKFRKDHSTQHLKSKSHCMANQDFLGIQTSLKEASKSATK